MVCAWSQARETRGKGLTSKRTVEFKEPTVMGLKIWEKSQLPSFIAS